jgi:diguanylate cyclase (GGDEF)-like protein
MSKPDEPKLPTRSLKAVVGQGERVQVLVEEAAEDLGTVNAALKAELAPHADGSVVEKAIDKSEAVEGKVQEASDELAVMNRALKAEVRERHALEVALAAVTQQSETDRHASLHDALTGLPNRALFHDRLEHGIAQARRHGWKLAVMFVDLDAFKRINDDFGHEAGDAVLRTIATRLTTCTRSDDTVSRHGGDEFLYLLLEVKRDEDVDAIARSLSDVIAVPCEIDVNGVVTPLVVRASIGHAIFPRDGVSAEALIAAADKAMYVVKRSGPPAPRSA